MDDMTPEDLNSLIDYAWLGSSKYDLTLGIIIYDLMLQLNLKFLSKLPKSVTLK